MLDRSCQQIAKLGIGHLLQVHLGRHVQMFHGKEAALAAVRYKVDPALGRTRW